MTEKINTVLNLVESVMTLIPEGLDLTYFNNRTNNNDHILLLMPEKSTNTCWWVATNKLSEVVNKVKHDINNVNNASQSGDYAFILRMLRKNTCRVYLWMPPSKNSKKQFIETLTDLIPKAIRKKLNKDIAMETWCVTLAEHPEFTCIVSVNPSRYANVEKIVVKQAMCAWRRALKLSEDPTKKRAHSFYAIRNRDKLCDERRFVCRKIASFSTHSAFSKYKLFEWNDWLTPTKGIKLPTECIYFTDSGIHYQDK